MLIQHSQPIVLNRMARIEAQSLETATALIARYKGEMMIKDAVANLDRPAKAEHLVDTRA